ncbi:MAG: MATE family efflux transporter [Lachnospiraceae bacterium]|nr:MATE family efflux transporter [Lachnospiraceae bacterium]
MNELLPEEKTNPLENGAVGKLIAKFAIPAIIGGLISAAYNIVDQIFIGQSVGLLGNAATNVAFPLVTISNSLALLFGVGSASNFSLELGDKRKDSAVRFYGNGISFLLASGILLLAAVLMLLHPLLILFGATEDVLPYALTYTGITAFGLPFSMISIGGGHLIRADGSPTYAMLSTASGAILNCFLDPLFIFGFHMGIAGAAYATITGQIISALLVLYYFKEKFKTTKLERRHFCPSVQRAAIIASLGAASCFNQLAMSLVQITLNNTLRSYGASSIYGSDIPLACVGVISKVNVLFMAFVLGIAQGCQPIFGFNYGAKNYSRVRETYKKAAAAVTVICIISFLCFQIFPRQIVSIFGTGSELYFEFAEKYFRIYLLFTFINGIQPLTSNFFTSIGKARLGIIMSLTRQIIFLLPLILLLPVFWGIDGVMYAGPIADAAAVALAGCFAWREMKTMRIAETEQLP